MEDYTPEQSSKKRSQSHISSDDYVGEIKRLRDKNRTNSKRFRDRKKSYMDGLFEEKYRLGKESNDLKATQAKIQAMLQEALAENEIHRRTQGALYNPLPPSLEALAEIRSKLLPVSGGADPAPETLKTPSAPLQIPPALRATQVDDYVALARPDVIVSPYLSLLGEIQAQQERNLLENLARQRLAGHLFASQPPLGGFGVQGNFSHLL